MKVSDLEGPLLDFWVARAEGNLVHGYSSHENAMVEHYGFGGEIEGRSRISSWAPSEEWDSGGPIISRERISIWRYDGTVDNPIDMWFAATGGIHGWDDGSIAGVGKECCGETALVAAMRAYVASKFGDEVPDVKS